MKIFYEKTRLLTALIAVTLLAWSFNYLIMGEASAGPGKCKSFDACEVSSRECKMLLLAEKFGEPDAAMGEFWNLVESAGAATGIKVKKNPAPDEATALREVSFIDTKNFDFYKNRYMLRRRIENGKIGLTLKYRSLDQNDASSADVSPAPAYGGKTAIDEDVVVKEHLFEHVFSKSGKTGVDSVPGSTLGSYAAIYPGLMRLGLAPNTPLCVVNGIKIEETAVEYGSIRLSDSVKAEASFSIWRLAGGDGVFIAEFSYRYKFKDSPSAEELLMAHHASDKFLDRLRDLAKSWLAAGLTKTGMVYKINTPNAE